MILTRNIETLPSPLYRAIGLMSGTSLDGVDAALIETDGRRQVRSLGFVTLPYPSGFRERVRGVFGMTQEDDAGTIAKLARDLTDHHLAAILSLLVQTGFQADEIDIIGFHGQTITHLPEKRFTWQIGDPDHLAATLRRPVVFDFRVQDVAQGGQGAPLIPIYHQALVARAGLVRPIALLNLGGVGNITYIGAQDDDLVAFDTGPGNALIDDLMLKRTGNSYDHGGETGLKGKVNESVLARWLAHPFFQARPPKSLDRNAFQVGEIADLWTEDAAATLAAFTARAVKTGFAHLPQMPARVLVTGGGRHNGAIMRELAACLPCPVETVDSYALNGDALEAEGFAYMAVRALEGLPISFPGTTGVSAPLTGGKIYGV